MPSEASSQAEAVSPTEASKSTKGKNKRKYISVKIKRQVFARAEHRCEYISPISGTRCSETKYLTIDHKQPLALGGTDSEANLRVCCFAHNLAEAKRMGVGRPQTHVQKLESSSETQIKLTKKCHPDSCIKFE